MSHYGIDVGETESHYGIDVPRLRHVVVAQVSHHDVVPLDPLYGVLTVQSGGVTTTTAVVVARVLNNGPYRLAVSTDPGFASPVYGPEAVAGEWGHVRLTVSGLAADTAYYYALESDAVLLTDITGEFRTAPSGAASFSFAHSGCNDAGADDRVFDGIRLSGARFFVHLGDYQYENIAVDNSALFVAQYVINLGSARQSQLYGSMPVAYVWDDHDFGDNNSDGTSPSRPAAAVAYRECFPHYDLPGVGDNPIYQSFTYGRVRFVLTDTRWARSPNDQADDASKTMLGATQLAWLKAQLLDAKNDPTMGLIVWGNATPWIAGGAVDDSWGLYQTERDDLVSYIAANSIDSKLCIISSDLHASCYDDGTNAPGGFPVFHAGSLTRSGNSRGGPYSSGAPDEGSGRYGLVEITDVAGVITVDWSAIEVNATTGVETVLMSHSFSPA